MIQKFVLTWRNLLGIDERDGMRGRMLEVILFVGSIIMIVASVEAAIMNESPYIVISLAGSFIVMCGTIFISAHFKHREIGIAIMCLMMNIWLLPLAFVAGGGIVSGSPSWFIFGIVFVFMFLSGPLMLVVLLISIASIGWWYVFCYMHPDFVVTIESPMMQHIDSFWAVVTVGILLGVSMYAQNRIYEKENEKTRAQRDEIEQLNQSQNRFFSNMSHEIRTPINTVIGLNEMTLRDESISDDVVENSRNIQSASRMLLSLINDILDLSKLESGSMQVVPVQYETGALFSDLVNMIWIRAKEKNLDFRVHIDSELPSMLFGDEVRIKQIMINLLTNAIKYTHDGSVTLSAHCEQIGGNLVQLHITVQDTGIGIRKENLENLFDAFKRVDEKKNRNIEGTGLGLSIAKQLANIMGGTITVDSIYTKGSIFTLIVDQQIVDETPLGDIDLTAKNTSASREKFIKRFEAPDARILVVDDNEMNRLVVKKLLRHTEMHIDAAASGEECLKLCQENYYNVILMDHLMPDMDGIETLKNLRKMENCICVDTPAIALTANAGSDAEQLYRNNGFQAYLSKPVNGAALENMVLRYLPEELVEYNKAARENTVINTVERIAGGRRIPVVISTDSVCDIPREWIDSLGIEVVPGYVITPNGRFYDGAEVDSDDIRACIKDNPDAAFSSDAASVEEYERFFGDLLMKAEQIIHISMSSALSKAYERATEAADGFDNVHVIDSAHMTCGMGLIVTEAAEMVYKGAEISDVLERIVKLRKLVNTSFVTSLTLRMAKKGALGRLSAVLTRALTLTPVFTMRNGRLHFRTIAPRAFGVSSKIYIHSALGNVQKIDPRVVMIAYSDLTEEELQSIEREIKAYNYFHKIQRFKINSAFAMLCDDSTFGLMYIRKDKEVY